MDRAGLAAAGVALTGAWPANAVSSASGVSARTGRDGFLRLGFERRGARTVAASCRSTLPLQVLAPMALDDPAAVVSILNPTGGLVGGDRLAIDVVAGAGAHACLTTPSATKVYRSGGEAAVQDVTLRLASDAVVEWVPDHTIPFAGSIFRQRIHVTLGARARLILVDAFAAGRVARGEAWTFGVLDSALTISDEGGCRLHDRFVLEGGARWTGLGLAEGAPYFATMVVAGDGGSDVLGSIQRALAGSRDIRHGAAPLSGGGAIVRCLAPTAPALLDTLDTVWSEARRALLGLPALVLRKP